MQKLWFIYTSCLLAWRFCPGLASAALLEVGRQSGCSSHKFLMAIWIVWHLPINFFTKCLVQHLGIPETLSVGPFLSSVSPLFPRGSKYPEDVRRLVGRMVVVPIFCWAVLAHWLPSLWHLHLPGVVLHFQDIVQGYSRYLAVHCRQSI